MPARVLIPPARLPPAYTIEINFLNSLSNINWLPFERKLFLRFFDAVTCGDIGRLAQHGHTGAVLVLA